ncbi:MAG TPA: UPF0182 family protein [Terriglobales bacterium]|nr:UPF0182 family protein [Terriglobales bacterium]
MSEPMGWRQVRRPVHSPTRPPVDPRRYRWLLAVLAAFLIVLIGGRTWLSYYVDALWFRSLGYADVFWKSLSLQSAVFCIFLAATFFILYGTFLILRRTYPNAFPSHTFWVGNYSLKIPLDRIARLVAIAVSLIISFGTAAVMMSEWPSFALYWYAPRNPGAFADPIFGKPLTFYLFSMPVLQLIAGWLMLLAIITCAAAVFFAFAARAGNALEGVPQDLRSTWGGFSVTFAFLLLVVALRVYVSRFETLFDDHTIFGGVTYTDAHVMLPGILVICVALIIGAGIAIANAVMHRRGSWLLLALLPTAVCYFAVQGIAWYVGTFVVKPNELVREKPYITNNIGLTRQAFDLDQVSQREFPAENSVQALDAANNQATLQNIRLWDWRALQDTLRQIQEIRTYYDFPDIDIDRYVIDGQLREVMLATRELNVDKLPESSRNWINDRLIYTHGYGVTMNPVNGFTPEGLPKMYLSDMPVQSTVPGLAVTRPEVYFGELTNGDVYVNTKQKEFNYPQGQSNSFTSYQGNGGIVLGGLFRRVLVAMSRGDLAKLPFSDDITPESRLLMRRNVLQRVSALAPFLTFEPDPYIVVGEDGRLSWIIDAFTTSDSFPYSSHYQLYGNSVNYIRNSVKVVVDAYDGTTTFYVFDSRDPIIGAYRRLFPTLFKDAGTMPAGLRRHVRYPELLLSLQARVYGLYHMTDPEVFYNREDLWNVASEVAMSDSGGQATRTMQPNFILMKLPGEDQVEFVEILPFTPANRNNLIGWIAARSDGDHYGTALVYNFPKTKLVDGPLQIEARIDQNAQLSGQLTLWNQQGSHVRRGAMLVIPSGRALLYAEPIYLQAERSPMPELRLVVLGLQDRLAYGPTFESAMEMLFGGASATELLGPVAPSQAANGAGASQSADMKALIAQAAKDLSDYQRLTSEGKLGEAGQKLDDLKRTLDQLNSRSK